MIKIGNAPCSWGVEFADDTRNPDWRRVLKENEDAGYTGIELGPVGYMPEEPIMLAEALSEFNQELIGGVVFRAFHDPDAWDDVLDGSVRTCKALAAHGAKRLVIIDSISPRRAPTAGRASEAEQMNTAEWVAYRNRISTIAKIGAEEYGLSVGMHAHAAGFIDFEPELERLLGEVDDKILGLCFDTGHHSYAGFDPVAFMKKYISRINYMHFKDIDPKITHRVSPRVLPILYSQQRELGKSSVLRWLGLEGKLLKAIPKLGQDVYAEKQGGIFNDDREFKLMLSGGLVINFDDVGELMMNAKSKDGLKSYCTMVSVQQRILHSNKVAHDRRRASIWGSTNDLILRDESENRFCIFELTELIDFEWLNSVDPLDLWRQARAECLELGDESNFTRSDTDLIKDIAKRYMFTNDIEDAIKSQFIYDPSGEVTYSDVKCNLFNQGFEHPSTNAISKAVKRIIPEGKKEKRIVHGGDMCSIYDWIHERID